MTKQLQQDSKYNQFDTDADGVVTDAPTGWSKQSEPVAEPHPGAPKLHPD